MDSVKAIWDAPCSCGGTMIFENFEKYCTECGLIDETFQGLQYPDWSGKKSSYEPSEHFETVLSRLQGEGSERLNARYIEKLKSKLEGDHSLKNIHKNLPNKDQRYLNYIYYKLTDKKLFIEIEHRELLKHKFSKCYSEYHDIKGKRPCALNIIHVVVDSYPFLSYINPFIHTRFKLSEDIYTRLKNVIAN